MDSSDKAHSITETLQVMLYHVDRIIEIGNGWQDASFLTLGVYKDACAFNFDQLGRMTAYVEKEYIAAHPEIPWNALYELHKRITREYEGISRELLWDIIQQSLPKLQKDLRELIREARL